MTWRLIALGLGTICFAMGDVLVEPNGGEVLALGVGATIRLTAALVTILLTHRDRRRA